MSMIWAGAVEIALAWAVILGVKLQVMHLNGNSSIYCRITGIRL